MPKITKNLLVSIKAVIFFSLLLALTSFYSGLSYYKSQSSSNPVAEDTFSVTKTKKPSLQFFVMSFCPYGNQMEDILRPVFDLLGNKVEIKPQYIFDKITDLPSYCKSRNGDIAQCATYVENGYFTNQSDCQKTINQNYQSCLDESAYIKSSSGDYYASLHGRVEANQDVREICAWNQNEDKTKWWDFVNNVNQNCTAQNADTCWEEEAKKADLDTAKISQCFNNEAIDLIEREIALTTKYQVSGSPTVLVNEEKFPPESAYTQDGTGSLKIGKKTFTQANYRTPNVIKEAVCSAFTKSPSDCKDVLPQIDGAPASQGGC